jgi:hypothetical protein
MSICVRAVRQLLSLVKRREKLKAQVAALHQAHFEAAAKQRKASSASHSGFGGGHGGGRSPHGGGGGHSAVGASNSGFSGVDLGVGFGSSSHLTSLGASAAALALAPPLSTGAFDGLDGDFVCMAAFDGMSSSSRGEARAESSRSDVLGGDSGDGAGSGYRRSARQPKVRDRDEMGS